MRTLLRTLFGITVLTVAVALAVPASLPVNAQDGGGVVIDSTFGGAGPSTLNNLLCNETVCARVVGFIYPTLLGIDPRKDPNWYTPGAQGSLAKEWTVSDDGKTYTFKLREDAKWSDGTPITAKTIVYGYQMATNPDSKSPIGASYLTTIESVEAPDDYTLVVKYSVAECTALGSANSIPVAPAHILGEDATKIKDHPIGTSPTVTWGPFKFGELRAGELTTLLRDESYPDVLEGSVKPEAYYQKVFGTQTIQLDEFLAGLPEGVNFIDRVPDARVNEVKKAAEEGKVQLAEFGGRSWDYISFNLADPKNPQPGLDKDGKPVDQGHHPIFGDVRVRRAIAMGINIDEIIAGPMNGNGKRTAANQIPTSWAYNPDVKPVPYDPAGAQKLLDEAGWVLEAGNTFRTAKGAMYAPDGTPLKFELVTNQGNVLREQVVTIVKDQLARVGIEVDAKVMDFAASIEYRRGQTYDAVLGGWQNGFPVNPDQTGLFLPEADIPGAGNNYPSYNNPKVNELMAKARTLPGCDQAERAKLYGEIQAIMAEDLPYVFMYSPNLYYAAHANVKNFQPYFSLPLWNVDTWTVTE